VYLDQGRYRFLDLTQYHLLGGVRDLGWCRHPGWCGSYMAYLPQSGAPPAGQHDRVIPEPCTAAFVALGALIALRTRKRNRVR
jgi:hypothetical protein